jgi:hypothetical protein
MFNVKKATGYLLALSLLPLAITSCTERTVSFSEDVKPILDLNCLECHQAGGKGQLVSGLNMTDHQNLMKGTRNGPMIIAGDPLGSNLLVLMEGRADPSINMPHGDRDPVGKEDIQTVKLWITQGAKDN